MKKRLTLVKSLDHFTTEDERVKKAYLYHSGEIRRKKMTIDEILAHSAILEVNLQEEEPLDKQEYKEIKIQIVDVRKEIDEDE